MTRETPALKEVITDSSMQTAWDMVAFVGDNDGNRADVLRALLVLTTNAIIIANPDSSEGREEMVHALIDLMEKALPEMKRLAGRKLAS